MTFNALLRALQVHEPAVHSFCQALPSLSPKQRKALLTACRVQVDPGAGPSRIRSRLIDIWTSEVPRSSWYTPSAKLIQLIDLIPNIASPIWSGFASMMIRSTPYLDYSPVMEDMEEAKWKEISAAGGCYHPQKLNWSAVFSDSKAIRHSTPLIPGTIADARINDVIHYSMCQAKARVSKRLLYPDYSDKTLGKQASSVVKYVYQNMKIPVLREKVGFATVDLEIIYHYSGGMVLEGLTEMRMAWKYNDLKPRVYYARGPSVYYESRYIQEIFNVFVDALDATHRHLRFAHHSVVVNDLETIFIYDYTSFTSTLHEVRNFVDALADFCKGTQVTVVDTVLGPVVRDLGEIIQRFNDVCQKDPEFDINGILDPRPEEPTKVVHNCGMLGVPGNITSCTLLHGIFLMCLLRTLMAKVVGDDAIGHGVIESREGLCEVLKDIGIVALEKMEFWDKVDEEGSLSAATWHYCKRPLCRFENRTLVGVMVDFPSAAVISKTYDGYHTVHPVDDWTHRKKVAGMLLSLVRQAYPVIQTDEERRLLNIFIHWANLSCGLLQHSPKTGYTVDHSLIFPRHISDLGFADGIANSYWDNYVTLPVVWDDSLYSWDEDSRSGVLRGSKALKLAKDLGYASQKLVTESFVVRMNESRFLSFLNRERFASTVEVQISRDIPTWLLNLCVPARVELPQEDPDDYLVVWDQYREGVDSDTE